MSLPAASTFIQHQQQSGMTYSPVSLLSSSTYNSMLSAQESHPSSPQKQSTSHKVVRTTNSPKLVTPVGHHHQQNPPKVSPFPQVSPHGIQLLKTSTGIAIVTQSSSPGVSAGGLDHLVTGRVGGSGMTAVVSQIQLSGTSAAAVTATRPSPLAHGGKTVSVMLSKQSPGGISPVSPSILASHLLSSGTSVGSSQQQQQIPVGAKLVQTGSKPVAFSLLQQSPEDHGIKQQLKHLQATGVQQPGGQTKTVVLSSKAGTVSGQQFVATLKQGGQEKTLAVGSTAEDSPERVVRHVCFV